MIKTPIAIAATARGGTFVCATGVGTIGLEPDFNTLQRLISSTRTNSGLFEKETESNLANLNGRNDDG
jgi:hypothetical protein